MREIPLSRGMFAIVDDEDYSQLASVRWYAAPGRHTFYAKRDVRRNGSKGRILMHRYLLGCPDGLEVDHKNGNGLDNRRSNIRIATRSQNRANTGLQINNISGVKGVCRCAETGRWKVRVQWQLQNIWVGRFDSLEEAVEARYEVVMRLQGEFAYEAR